MTVYIELVFFENFAIDYFLFLSGGRIAFIKPEHPIIASLLGALYAVIMPIFYNTSFLQTFLTLAVLCYICYTPKKMRIFIYSFIAVSACASALFGVMNLFFASFKTGVFYEDNAFFVISLLSVLLSVGAYRLLIPFMRKKSIEECLCTLRLSGKEISAFVDSGNALYYKDIPVILVNSSLVKMPEKPLIIPYSAIGKEGALLGFIPENVCVTYMNKEYFPKCVIALYDSGFHKKFDALLHPDLLKECI